MKTEQADLLYTLSLARLVKEAGAPAGLLRSVWRWSRPRVLAAGDITSELIDKGITGSIGKGIAVADRGLKKVKAEYPYTIREFQDAAAPWKRPERLLWPTRAPPQVDAELKRLAAPLARFVERRPGATAAAIVAPTVALPVLKALANPRVESVQAGPAITRNYPTPGFLFRRFKARKLVHEGWRDNP